ncbi:MAG: hypothetical protein M0R03_13900 [Novosphingobium sp.]|nr:hypothetical protein [Novosphingobium sp.]
MPTLALMAGPAAMAATETAFVPPTEPMVLTRTLQRALPDGKQIVTRRSYEIRFTPDGDGYRVDGTLLSAGAEVPPSLEMLAALERARPDTGLFPMRLDRNGALLPHGDDAAPADAAVVQAARLTSSMLTASDLPKETVLQGRNFVDSVARNGLHTQWPTDLFRPAAPHRRETLSVPLPDGTSGRVGVELDTTAAETGLVLSFRRIVTTELGTSTRRTTETWTLAKGG